MGLCVRLRPPCCDFDCGVLFNKVPLAVASRVDTHVQLMSRVGTRWPLELAHAISAEAFVHLSVLHLPSVSFFETVEPGSISLP